MCGCYVVFITVFIACQLISSYVGMAVQLWITDNVILSVWRGFTKVLLFPCSWMPLDIVSASFTLKEQDIIIMKSDNSNDDDNDDDDDDDDDDHKNTE